MIKHPAACGRVGRIASACDTLGSQAEEVSDPFSRRITTNGQQPPEVAARTSLSTRLALGVNDKASVSSSLKHQLLEGSYSSFLIAFQTLRKVLQFAKNHHREKNRQLGLPFKIQLF